MARCLEVRRDAAVGNGVSEARANQAVEEIMTGYPAAAAFGALKGPATHEP